MADGSSMLAGRRSTAQMSWNCSLWLRWYGFSNSPSVSQSFCLRVCFRTSSSCDICRERWEFKGSPWYLNASKWVYISSLSFFDLSWGLTIWLFYGWFGLGKNFIFSQTPGDIFFFLDIQRCENFFPAYDMKDIFFAMYFRARIFSLEISMQNFFSQITHTPPPSSPQKSNDHPISPKLTFFYFSINDS